MHVSQNSFFTVVQSFDAKYYVVSVINNIVNLQMNKYAYPSLYRGADKSLARPGRKQANVSVRMA
jgi:hypothetical protein